MELDRQHRMEVRMLDWPVGVRPGMSLEELANG